VDLEGIIPSHPRLACTSADCPQFGVGLGYILSQAKAKPCKNNFKFRLVFWRILHEYISAVNHKMRITTGRADNKKLFLGETGTLVSSSPL
jgi:hypothetical protein